MREELSELKYMSESEDEEEKFTILLRDLISLVMEGWATRGWYHPFHVFDMELTSTSLGNTPVSVCGYLPMGAAHFGDNEDIVSPDRSPSNDLYVIRKLTSRW